MGLRKLPKKTPGVGVSNIYRKALSEFRADFFTGKKKPCANTLKKWIERGDICGERIGNHYFVLVDARGEPIKSDTGNKDANEMLKKWRSH